jgi:glycosyltransferase involved in cell wall biosynthesis
LKQYLKNKNHKIEFLGRKNFEEIIPFLESCAFTIVPSECYDNFPNTVLESYAFKKAVIASRLGSLTDMIDEGQTGFLFTAKDHLHLKEKVDTLISNPQLCEQYGKKGFEKIANEYSEETHYAKLMDVFASVLNNRTN